MSRASTDPAGGRAERPYEYGDNAPVNGTAPDDPRIALLVADLVRRLRPVCRDWDDAEFEALVHRIAQMKVRWAEAKR